jgi:hypothetical protein
MASWEICHFFGACQKHGVNHRTKVTNAGFCRKLCLTTMRVLWLCFKVWIPELPQLMTVGKWEMRAIVKASKLAVIM